ncbi:molybdopterin-dependent oxidoreductase [Saliphagus sp. LR7]|uniref:molybdopterin-dependent oxidoreductase n=1 Tax=Saliphagus sp. LR7 TaxID=2282654 RepID=UPI000DF784CE|nr:molybdopterin-dependent oxidoreductase [Saliphagus sp. LR7]
MNTASTRFERAAIGIVVAATWIAASFVVSPLVGGFAVVTVAEAVIVRSPGWLSSSAIGLLGFAAQPALVAGVVAAVLAAAAIAEIVRPRAPDVLTPAYAVAVAVATAWLFLATGGGLSIGVAVAFVVAVGAPYLAAQYLTRPPAPPNRRRFLRRVGGVVAAGAVSAAGLRALFSRFESEGGDRAGEPLSRSISPPSGDPAFDFEGMPAAVTPPRNHYTIDISVDDPDIDPESWSLGIDGAVEEPYELGYEELRGHDDSVEQTTTLICISNPVGGDLIGTAHWTGVPLSSLVEAAEPAEGAVDLVTHAADGYSEAIPLELVEREDVLIAYGMGEQALPRSHGFPARLLVPGRYGMKMTKWITRIEVAEAEHEAYWEQRDWNERAIANTMSYVRAATREGDRVTVGGVAFGGLETGVEEIAGVEVSVDGGETWNEGELEAQLAPHAWRRWRYAFDAPDGSEFDVVVRAIEADGTVQTDEEADTLPDGATGWHRETVQV